MAGHCCRQRHKWGFNTEILYGPAAPRSRSSLVNEANIVEPTSPVQRRTVDKALRYVEARTGGWSAKAWPTPISGEVLWPESRGGQPPAKALWAADSVYSRAARSFKKHNRPLSIRFDENLDRPAPDVMHWTVPLPLHATGRPNIYTIHDLIPLTAPHTTIHDRDLFMRLHAHIARRADHIAVVSETTRQDVIRLLGVPEDRVTNTYQTLSIPLQHTAKTAEEVSKDIEETYGLGWKDYYIHFGAIEPKKNLGRIVEAYIASGSRRPLVIVGGRGWLQEDETALIAQVRRDQTPPQNESAPVISCHSPIWSA